MLQPVRIRRYVLRIGLFVAIIGMVILVRTYGTVRVPVGMDTMPSLPAGTTCIIQKRPSSVRKDSVVFVDLDDGSTVLARIATVDEQGALRLVIDNRESRFRALETRLYSLEDVRGLVLASFAPNG